MGLHLQTIIGVCNDLKLLYKDRSLQSRHCILDTSAATTTYSKSWVRPYSDSRHVHCTWLLNEQEAPS